MSTPTPPRPLVQEPDLGGRKVLLHDMCLRDGMHAKREQIAGE